MVMFMSDFLKE